MFESLIYKMDEDYLFQLLNLANPQVVLKTQEENRSRKKSRAREIEKY